MNTETTKEKEKNSFLKIQKELNKSRKYFKYRSLKFLNLSIKPKKGILKQEQVLVNDFDS